MADKRNTDNNPPSRGNEKLLDWQKRVIGPSGSALVREIPETQWNGDRTHRDASDGEHGETPGRRRYPSDRGKGEV